MNDNVWHHFAFAWSGANGRWDLLIDGTPWALRTGFKVGATIPAGGRLVIGQLNEGYEFVAGEELLGRISRVNLWDRALSGEELEDLSQSPDASRGNILRWFQVLRNVHGPLEIVPPSKAENTSKNIQFTNAWTFNLLNEILKNLNRENSLPQLERAP